MSDIEDSMASLLEWKDHKHGISNVWESFRIIESVHDARYMSVLTTAYFYFNPDNTPADLERHFRLKFIDIGLIAIPPTNNEETKNAILTSFNTIAKNLKGENGTHDVKELKYEIMFLCKPKEDIDTELLKHCSSVTENLERLKHAGVFVSNVDGKIIRPPPFRKFVTEEIQENDLIQTGKKRAILRHVYLSKIFSDAINNHHNQNKQINLLPYHECKEEDGLVLVATDKDTNIILCDVGISCYFTIEDGMIKTKKRYIPIS